MRFNLISGEDRRHFTRFYRIRLLDIGLGGVSVVTPTLRLDGLHFFYDLIPTVRNRIMMQIHLPNQMEPVTALGYAIQGRIVRVQGRRAYMVGIHFLQISEAHGERLRAFVDLLEKRRGMAAAKGNA
jgi:c-di-GMP-binding flagellar brake protein YcgR